ncbi:MAG: kelch repeat-containing protein [Cyclobacteriaceae bacterium]
MRQFYLILLLIFPTCLTMASGIDSLRGIMRSFYYPERDLIVRTYLDGISVLSPDQPSSEKRRFIKKWSIEEALSNFYFDKDDLYMVHQLNGSVFRVINDSLEVIEKMEHLKMFIEAKSFIYDSSFYMLGGYGLWSVRDKLVRLNEFHRWEPVLLCKRGKNTKASELFPGMFGGQAIISRDKLYVFNGRTINMADPLEKPLLKDVWQFDFVNKTWSNLGALNEDLFFEVPERYATIKLQDRHLIFKKQKALIELFPQDNRVVLYEHTLISMEVMNGDFFQLPAFLRKGRVYFYRNYNSAKNLAEEKRTYEFTSVPVEALYGARIGEDVFYKESWSWLKSPVLWIISATVFITGVGGFFYSRKPRFKPKLTDTGVRYRGKHYDISLVNLTVLKKLYNSQGPVSSQEIMEIVQNPNLQYSHNNRMKNDVIRQLNIQLQSILNTGEELITMTNSETDKRYKWYELKRGLFQG